MHPKPAPHDRLPFDAADRAIASALRAALPPPGLKERILAAPEVTAAAVKTLPGPWFAKPAALWVAAAALLVAALTIFGSFGQATSFDDVRDRIVSVDAPKLMRGGLSWAVKSADRATINAYLRTANLAGDLSSYRPPAHFDPLGCQVFTWRGVRYSAVCFYDPNGNGVHLFMVQGGAFAREPGPTPQLARIAGLPTAIWSKDGVSYILVGSGWMDLQDVMPAGQEV